MLARNRPVRAAARHLEVAPFLREQCDAVIGGFNLIVSRTGYTGEKMAFELFVHPERATHAGEQDFRAPAVPSLDVVTLDYPFDRPLLSI